MAWFSTVPLLGVLCCSMLLVRGIPFPEKKDKSVRTSEPLKSCAHTEWDMAFNIPHGQSLKRGCNVYTCDNGHLSPPTHTCPLEVGYLENIYLCLRRSSDGCCCEEVGCKDVFDEVHPVGSLYRETMRGYDLDRPECGEFCVCSVDSPCQVDPCFIPHLSEAK